jgi:hypothetical protein
MSRSSVALSNLRAVVILIVLAFHAVLPYLASLPATPYRFDVPPYQWRAFPIIDSQRWFGFDLFCAWQDVSLMALMFFVSGLFVASSLERKGSWTFLCLLPGLCRNRRRPESRRLLAAFCRAALLAVRTAMVSLVAHDLQRCRRGIPPTGSSREGASRPHGSCPRR